MKILLKMIDGMNIHQRNEDGYVFATSLCQHRGKKFADYYCNKKAKQFLNKLSSTVGIPTDKLVIKIMTGLNEERGTWVHPTVAIHLGQWLSLDYTVQVALESICKAR